MSNFKRRLSFLWRDLQTRLKLILTACNFSKPLPQLLTQQQHLIQKQAIGNQLLELGVDTRLPAELDTVLNNDTRLRRLVNKALSEECLKKQATALMDVVVAHAKSVAQTMPLPDNESESATERVEKWRIERIAPLLLASELIMIKERRGFTLPVFTQSRSEVNRDQEWREQIVWAYSAIAKHIEKPKPWDPEVKNQKLYLYPLVQESDCGIWVGNEHGLLYGPGMSFYLDVSGELCANLLTARGVQIIATLALRHCCGFYPAPDPEWGYAFDLSAWGKPEKDKHRNKRLNNYISELSDIYIMGDAHGWTTVAAKAEEAYTRQLADPTTDNQWQAQLNS